MLISDWLIGNNLYRILESILHIIEGILYECISNKEMQEYKMF
jgi:hypothetical protein